MFRCELSGEATTGGGAPTFPLSLLFYVCSKIRSQFCKTLRQFSKQVSGNLGAPCPSWTQYKIDGAIWPRLFRFLFSAVALPPPHPPVEELGPVGQLGPAGQLGS